MRKVPPFSPATGRLSVLVPALVASSMTGASSGVPARLGVEHGRGNVLVADLGTLGRPPGNGGLRPLLVALLPRLHPLRILRGVLGLRLGELELGLVVRPARLVAEQR